MVKTITRYGRLCTQNLCNFKARPGESPFKMRMVDPAMCFPTYAGDHGMVTMTLVYRQRVGDLIGRYENDDDFESKVLNISYQDKATQETKTYRYNDEIEVIEYWDCAWMGIFAAGKLVKGPVKHDYGEPPFVYTIAPYGDPSYTRSPDQRKGTESDGTLVTSVQQDVSRRGLSHFHNRFVAHAQYEAVMGRLMTQYGIWLNGPIWYQPDGSSMGAERPSGPARRGRATRSPMVGS